MGEEVKKVAYKLKNFKIINPLLLKVWDRKGNNKNSNQKCAKMNFDANEMQRVPWMCWKRMSDNWKAYILAYAWPAPVSSRILWSLLLLSHS